MKARRLRDQRRRQLVAHYELQRLLYGSLVQDLSLPVEVRGRLRQAWQALPRGSAASGLVRRCVRTGRSRGVLRPWRLSRIAFRELAASGRLMGVTRLSW